MSLFPKAWIRKWMASTRSPWLWTAPSATLAFVWERIAKHARRVVFLSAPPKTQHPFFQQRNPAVALPERIERLMETSGLEWTFLRPGMFASNALGWWAPQIRAGNVVRWPYLAAPTAPIDERDVAAVGVRALCDDGHAGAAYVLTGPQPMSQFRAAIHNRPCDRALPSHQTDLAR
jgi:hypothetical protein